MESNQSITVHAVVDAHLAKVWEKWTSPDDIQQWNNASDDWHTPHAENDLTPGGQFLFRMEAKDGSMGFDFIGIYDAVKPHELIEYTLADGRKVKVTFAAEGDKTRVSETFDAESVHPADMQQAGWQAILNNFKKYCES